MGGAGLKPLPNQEHRKKSLSHCFPSLLPTKLSKVCTSLQQKNFPSIGMFEIIVQDQFSVNDTHELTHLQKTQGCEGLLIILD